MRLTLQKQKTCYVPNDPDGGYIDIVLLTKEQIARVDAKAMAAGLDGQGEGSITINPYARINGIARACLRGWGNMFDVKGKPMPFNAKNLAKATSLEIEVEGQEGSIRFLEWVELEHSKFESEALMEEDVAEKNS